MELLIHDRESADSLISMKYGVAKGSVCKSAFDNISIERKFDMTELGMLRSW